MTISHGFEGPTILHGNLLCSEVLLHGDGIIAPAFDTAPSLQSSNLLGVFARTHVLSLATIMQSTPETLPIPVMIPPAGTSSPG